MKHLDEYLLEQQNDNQLKDFNIDDIVKTCLSKELIQYKSITYRWQAIQKVLNNSSINSNYEFICDKDIKCDFNVKSNISNILKDKNFDDILYSSYYKHDKFKDLKINELPDEINYGENKFNWGPNIFAIKNKDEKNKINLRVNNVNIPELTYELNNGKLIKKLSIETTWDLEKRNNKQHSFTIIDEFELIIENPNDTEKRNVKLNPIKDAAIRLHGSKFNLNDFFNKLYKLLDINTNVKDITEKMHNIYVQYNKASQSEFYINVFNIVPILTLLSLDIDKVYTIIDDKKI